MLLIAPSAFAQQANEVQDCQGLQQFLETVDALINAGIDYPERLLFIEDTAIKSIPNLVGPRLEEVEAYLIMFRENR